MKDNALIWFCSLALVVILLIPIVSVSRVSAQQEGAIVTDIQGHTYDTIAIGEQEWMSANLQVTQFRDGSDVPNVTDMTDWPRLSTPAYSWYDNDLANRDSYGALYNWYAVNTGNLCPDGWRVPTDADWTTLTEFLGGESVATAGHSRATDSNSWNPQLKDAISDSGLATLPGGYRYGYYWAPGLFYERGANGYWWTATECTDTHVWTRTMSSDNSRMFRSFFVKNNGFSVRCIKSH